jgi:hypothetical protein
MATFVTLCKAYMGIEPHFTFWNYFFCAWLQQGLGMEVVALGSVDIFMRSSCGIDLYFHLPMFGPLDGWWIIWFFLRNDTDMPLPIFTGSHPISQPNWGYNVA